MAKGDEYIRIQYQVTDSMSVPSDHDEHWQDEKPCVCDGQRLWMRPHPDDMPEPFEYVRRAYLVNKGGVR